MQEHRGTISAQSETNKGSTFSILLPLSQLKFIPRQLIRIDGVVADAVAGRGLERESEGDGVIFRAGAVVNHAEGERGGPASQVAVEAVKLLLQSSVLAR